jgi:hypothetical protein
MERQPQQYFVVRRSNFSFMFDRYLGHMTIIDTLVAMLLVAVPLGVISFRERHDGA